MLLTKREKADFLHIPAYKYEDMEMDHRPKGATGFLPAFISHGGKIKPEIIIGRVIKDAPSFQSAQDQCKVMGGHLTTFDEYMAAYFWLQGWVQKKA